MRRAREQQKEKLALLLGTPAITDLDPTSVAYRVIYEAFALWVGGDTLIGLGSALVRTARDHDICAKLTLECNSILRHARSQARVRIA